MEKKGKGIETTVNQLPEPIIQHIQSFLNGKEAAQTTMVSKPWYTAWLTRPSLDFDESNFKNLPPESSDFEEFTAKTMQRYQDLNLDIQSFRLSIHTCPGSRKSYKLLSLAHNLVVNAIKIGATDLKLDLSSFIFPREVLESGSIIRLSLASGEINESCVACCSRLKSLSIDNVSSRNVNVLRDILTSCCASIEELSLFRIYMKIEAKPYELHKLKRLFLDSVVVDNTFFSDFVSEIPCLKDLSLVNCTGYTKIEMASTSLELIMIVQPEKRLMDKFDVPNIRKFTFSGGGVPSLSIKVPSTKEWEFHLCIKCDRFSADSWFQSMKGLLKRMRLSTITISLSRNFSLIGVKNDNFEVVPERVAVESLIIDDELSKFCSATLLRILGICCPKFITFCWLPGSSTSFAAWNESICMVCNEMSANRNTFGLNEVKVEVYEEIHTDEWRLLVLRGPLDASKPPVNKCKVIFLFLWEMHRQDPRPSVFLA